MEHNFSFLHDNDTAWFIYGCHVDLDTSARRVALFLLYLLFFTSGLLLNAVVLWVNWRRRKSRNGVLFCVLNLAISDLMMMMVVPFFMLGAIMDHVWLWGHFMCKFTNLFFVTAFYSSSLFLAHMTVERYLTVTSPAPRPWGPAERRRRALLCAAMWTASAVMAALESSHVRLLEWDEPGCYYYPEHNFVGWFVSLTLSSLIVQFLGPGVVVVTFNLLTLRALRAGGRSLPRRDVWLVHAYSVVFVLSWLPYHVDTLLMMLDDLEPRLMSCKHVEYVYFAYAVVQCLSLVHCVANPVLYNFLSRGFRGNLMKAVAQHLPREAVMTRGGAENHADAGEGGGTKKAAQEMNDSDTSQSDVES